MIGWFGLIARNARRSPLRGVMTVMAVAVSLVAFVLVRCVNAGWTDQVKQTPDNRVVTRNKIGWMATLPIHYVDAVRAFAGVRRATGATWGQLKLPTDSKVPFESIAVDPEPFVAMHYELEAPAEQKQGFVADRQAALVSAELANERGWSVGNVLHFKHAKIPAGVELTVSGIFQSQRARFAKRAVYFHWSYLNELLPESDRNQVNIVAAEVEDPSHGARMATRIDIEFDRGQVATLTQEDQAVNAQMVGQFSAILGALDTVSILILGIVLLVLANTLAMIVRERRKEYGVLRALGFVRKHVLRLALGEAALLGFLGSLLGLLLSFPLVQRGASGYLSDSMGLPPLHIGLESAAMTIAMGIMLGVLAALVPVYALMRLPVVDLMRRVL